AMVSVFVVARSLPSSDEMSRVNVLLNNGRLISERAAALFDRHHAEVLRLASMADVQDALRAGNRDALHDILENFARRADLDAALLTTPDGGDVFGVLRAERGSAYDPVTLQSAAAQAILTTAPVIVNGETLGMVHIGARASRWI